MLGFIAALAGCASAATPDEMGPTGLEGALPGGDGRAMLAYRSEYQGNVLQAMDSLVDRFHAAWRGSSPDSVAALYSEHASVVEPGGALLMNREGVRAWAEASLPTTRALNLWRDLFTASGEMAVTYGRYGGESGRGGGHGGFHVTVGRREGREWKVRSQLFITFEGVPPTIDSAGLAHVEEHITPEALRARRPPVRLSWDRTGMSEYTVDSYFRANSVLALWRHEWNAKAVDRVVAMLAPDAVVRLPWDVPAVGRTSAGEALRRFIPAVGALHMSILDFDVSERVSYCMGRYVVDVPNDVLSGHFIAVIREEDRGPQIRALIFAGAGASASEE